MKGTAAIILAAAVPADGFLASRAARIGNLWKSLIPAVRFQQKGNAMKQFSSATIVLLSISAAAFTSGCSFVTTKHPLSAKPSTIDQEKFEGAWFGVEEDQIVHVRFADNGVARIATLEWGENQFRILHAEMIVTEGDEHNFLSVRFQEDGKWQDRYGFCAYKFTPLGDLILWLPAPDVFEDMIKKKQLQGVVEQKQYNENIKITDEPGKLLEVINNPDNLNIFEYREPIILRKIPPLM